MEGLTLGGLMRKCEDAWDQLADVREGLEEMKQGFEDAIGDVEAEIADLLLEVGGCCKIVESFVQQAAEKDETEQPFAG